MINLRSISFRLVAWYAGWLTAIFLLLCALLYLDLRHFLENNLSDSQLRRVHQISEAVLAHVKQTGEPAAAAQIKDWYEPELNARFIRVTRADGTVIYASGMPHDGSFDPAQIPPATAAKKNAAIKYELPDKKTLLVTSLNFSSPGNPDYLVEYGQLLDPIQTMLNHLLLQLMLGLPLAVLIITTGGYLLVRRALAPVEQITRAAEHITQHNLNDRLPITHTGDEMERLSASLNRMIARLDDAFQNSKRFVADASHELRTPLTILRGELEHLTEDQGVTPEWRERAASLLEEALHLSKIVEQLFLLSRLDAGEAQAERTRFDLSELASTTADQLSLLAEDRHISITCEAPQPVTVEGDRVRLKQIVVNLLDNAIKYTPEKGAIKLRVLSASGQAILEVRDNGVGIAPEALPHVFERFYRADTMRADGSESAGLGLAIVKAICDAHDAHVEVTSTPGAGSCFRVTLPLSKN